MIAYPFSGLIPSMPLVEDHPALVAVSDFTKVPIRDILSSSRKGAISRARHMACYLMRFRHKMLQREIGRLLNKDHTTVVHSCHVIRDEWRTFKDDIEYLMSNDMPHVKSIV